MTRRSGRGVEIAFVTVLALGILFAVLYYLLPHYQAQTGRGDESSLRWPRIRGGGYVSRHLTGIDTGVSRQRPAPDPVT